MAKDSTGLVLSAARSEYFRTRSSHATSDIDAVADCDFVVEKLF